MCYATQLEIVCKYVMFFECIILAVKCIPLCGDTLSASFTRSNRCGITITMQLQSGYANLLMSIITEYIFSKVSGSDRDSCFLADSRCIRGTPGVCLHLRVIHPKPGGSWNLTCCQGYVSIIFSRLYLRLGMIDLQRIGSLLFLCTCRSISLQV